MLSLIIVFSYLLLNNKKNPNPDNRIYQNYVIEKDLFRVLGLDNQVQLVGFTPLNLEYLKQYKNRIKQLSKEFQNEAFSRGVIIEPVLNKFKFTNRTPKGFKNGSIAGHCDLSTNTIFLKETFSDPTFYHELGHCEFKYAHSPDRDVLHKLRSKNIMHWRFDKSRFANKYKKKESLDVFFDKSNYTKINTFFGTSAHKLMQLEYKNAIEMEKQLKKEKRGVD